MLCFSPIDGVQSRELVDTSLASLQFKRGEKITALGAVRRAQGEDSCGAGNS